MECKKTRPIEILHKIFKLFITRIKNAIINKHIIKQRKASIQKIIYFLQKFLKKKRQKEILLYSLIIKLRSYNIMYLQEKLKNLKFQKDVRRIIAKNRDYYCIECKIKNVKSVSLQVFLKNDTTKIFEFEYCKIRKVFVLYILRSLACGAVFRVHFLADDKVIIDPMFRTDYDDKGNFYNLIDFVQIEGEERNKNEEKERILKYYGDMLRKNRFIEETYFKR
jgi:hypothetical protein